MTDETPTPRMPRKFNAGRFALNAILVVVIIGAGVWAWDQYVKDQVIIRNYGVVVDGEIYRAGRQTPRTMKKLHDQHEIKTVIDLGAFLPGSERELEQQRVAAELGMERHRFDLEGDATGNPNDYVAALRLMTDESNYPLLIQCGAGAQRTTLAVMLYRHLVEGKKLEDVYPESFKHEHDPEDDWILLIYLAEHLEEIKRAYESGGWIPGYPLPTEYAQSNDENAPAESADAESVSGGGV